MPSRRTRTIVIAVLALVLVAAAAIPATVYLRERADRQRLREATQAFAAAWRAGRLESVAYAGAAGADVAKQAASITAALTPAATDTPAAVDLLGVDHTGKSTRAAERLRIRWDLGKGRTWEYETTVGVLRNGDAWQVEWSPAVIHPRLVAGQVLTAARTPAERGRILGSGGQVLVEPRPVVIVGIEPRRTTDRRATAAAVAAAVDVDAAALTKRVLAAEPTAFVDVIILREAAYRAVRSRLQPIPGAVFQETTIPLAPTASFARPVLGTVGLATAEIIKASGGRVQAGDITGLSGVQRRYDAWLAGTAGFRVTAGPPAGTGRSAAAPNPTSSPTSSPTTSPTTSPSPAAVPTIALYEVEPVAGRPLTLSLDQRVQQAAETVLASAPKPAGLVAIRPSTGEVLAVANGPANAAGFNRALVGRYPPGSTFKIATTYALLERGLSPSTPVACPPTLNVGGRVFKNAEDEALGTVPFSTDFANSCNTAFVGLSRRITPQQLADAATTLGYGRPNLTGVDAFMGSVPRSGDAVAHAADAIGQGQVLASPLTVASVTASIAAGRYLPPRVVVDPPAEAPGTSQTPGASPTSTAGAAPTASTPATTSTASTGSTGSAGSAGSAGSTAPAASAGSSAPTGAPLSQGTVAALRTLTGLVVTNGTGTALRSVPGEPVHGKTGTAEFGSRNPPDTHAWFTGYQGDLAVAVVVEGGGFGGEVAAPLAAKFLTTLA